MSWTSRKEANAWEAVCGLARLPLPPAADTEGAAADGTAAASFFLSSRGLSRDSSTVASLRERKQKKKKPDGECTPLVLALTALVFLAPGTVATASSEKMSAGCVA
ncbi:hypothetical protein EYF80_009892 [Liparis tanakae]|uniref:Uncharacterized protein n=1 Tax=Liparis tanakae TaxID=230148 RepID=A0A4Z2IPN6_9TELE|nr:hypothetical protein EYF80_009892 [Liparis tanakae]